MAFPNISNKYIAEALFSPGEFIKYKKFKRENFPKKIIITYQKNVARYFKRKFRGKLKKLPLYENNELLVYKNLGFIYVKGIGAPNVVTIVEELIALGGKEFVSIGSAGGLIKQGVFVCSKAIRDEGTSYHYIRDSLYAYPDKELTKKLEKTLIKFNIKYMLAPSWTIDAPYRETKKEISYYRKKGVYTAEMEASALFALGKFRKIKIAAIFVVSDLLSDKKWEPKFHEINFKKLLNKMVDVTIICFGAK